MSALRWTDFGSFTVDERQRFHVDYDNTYEGFTLTHDLGRDSAHGVGAVGRYPDVGAAEAAALAHVARAAAAGRPCYELPLD